MTTKLEAFLTRNVEGYLLEDLETMKPLAPKPGKDVGGVGYPLVMTVFSGIELLGGLLSPNAFEPNGRGAAYFTTYWRDYLYPSDSNRAALGPALYKLARHGLAHAFVTKGRGIEVGKGAPGQHLSSSDGKTIYVDAVRPAEDFADSYRSMFKPLVKRKTGSEPNAASIAARLQEMASEYEKQAKDLQFPTTACVPSVASGSAFPTIVTSKSW
jgi:hypothetical protein